MIGKIFPKISTRGFYDLKTGKTLRNTSYEIYPKTSFEVIKSSSGDFWKYFPNHVIFLIWIVVHQLLIVQF